MEKLVKDDLFTRWMNEAYRMETALMPILEQHISDAEGHQELQEKFQQHLHVTQHHADVVRGCLDRLGKPVPSDDATTTSESDSRADADSPHADTYDPQSVAVAQKGGNGDFGDRLIDDFLNDFSTVQYEIATYHMLVTAARDMGQMECERAFQQILYDEQKMAEWLDINLPLLVEQTIRHAA